MDNSLIRLQRCKQTGESFLNKIELCERLHYFGDVGEFDRGFVSELQWLKDTWLDRESAELFDSRIVAGIEDKLENMPFKDAVSYKQPIDEDLANICLDDDAEWKTNVCAVMAMDSKEQLEIYKRFEYMCYFIINVREELLFDIESQLNE